MLRLFALLLILLALPVALQAQAPIRYLEAKKLFVLDSGKVTYTFGVNERGELQHVYWGAHLWRDDELQPAHSSGEAIDTSPTAAQQEFAGWGGGLYFAPCLKITFLDGSRDLVLHYVSHEIAHDSLTVTLKDIQRPIFVRLQYTIYPETGMVLRQATIENRSAEPVMIENAQSGTWYLPRGDRYRLRYLAGQWGGEWQLKEEPVGIGSRLLESRTGSTGDYANPWFALDLQGSDDPEHGSVWFGALGWSGNWRIQLEQTPDLQLRVTGGYSPFDFAYHLAAGQTLTTPSFYGGYTDGGVGEASRLLHTLERTQILPGAPGARPRPVLYNSWYATEFTFNEADQEALAKKAAALGVERFVIDDGWFSKRKTDHAGLGDWYVDPDKFPHGLKPLIVYVKSLGMDFGLWVEPEMVNPDSDLYRKHPDWELNFPGRPRTEARHQLVLNLAREDVKEYTFHWLDQLVTDNDIAFLKWDHNRDYTEPGWPQVPPEVQKNLWVQYTKNLYEVIDRLRQKHPKLEIETCASGGARVDLGILQRTEQAWVSDDTDALDRLIMQEGFSYAYTPRIMENWVTDVPNGVSNRTVPLKFNFLVAMEGALGIGANLTHWPDSDLSTAKQMIAEYKPIRNTVQTGLLYRLKSMRDGGNFAATEYVAQDGSQTVLFAFLHSQLFGNAFPELHLQGLDPNAIYKVQRTDDTLVEQVDTMSGAYLMNHGISLWLKGDYDSTLLVFEKVQ